MKALALGLIRWMIDQVEQIVRITWRQGRVFDQKGMEGMKEWLESWSQGLELWKD